MSEVKPVIKTAEERMQEWTAVTELDSFIQLSAAQFRFYLSQEVKELRAALEASQKEEEISASLIDRLANLLTDIAVTIKGESEPLARHSFHDLPELVKVLHLENELNKQENAEQAKRIAVYEQFMRTCDKQAAEYELSAQKGTE